MCVPFIANRKGASFLANAAWRRVPKLSEVPTNLRALLSGVGETRVTSLVESDTLKQRQAGGLSFFIGLSPLWPGLVSVP